MVQDNIRCKISLTTLKNDISDIDIISHYWWGNGSKMAVKVTGLYTIGDEVVESEDMKFDYT